MSAEPLFIEPDVYFEKVGAEVDLPEDPNTWPKEILDELYKQTPYISDFMPHVVMDKVDAERGYGLGHVEISNQSEAQRGTDPQMLAASGVRTVRVPIVIKNGKLSPFDILVNDASKIVPLTESRLRQALFRPQAFDATSQTPGDQSMIGQLYPPYRQNYGFGGGGIAVPAEGMGKAGSVLEEFLIAELEKKDAGFRKAKVASELVDTAKEFVKHPKGSKKGLGVAALQDVQAHLAKQSSILATILPTIGPDDLQHFWLKIASDRGLQAQLRKNAAGTKDALDKLAKHQPMSAEKTAAILLSLVRPTVVQIVKRADGYLVKAASHLYWRPFHSFVHRGELIDRFGEKIAREVDTAGAVTLAEGAEQTAPEAGPDLQPVSRSGVYKVVAEGGKELVGFVVPNLLDIDGQALPLSLFTNGSHATIQSEIFGEPSGDGENLPAGEPGGFGAFYTSSPDGGVQATLPMNLTAGYTDVDQPKTLTGETYDGRPVEVSVQPNIQELTPMEEGKLLVPMTWRWVPLDGTEKVSLAGGEEAAQLPEEGPGADGDAPHGEMPTGGGPKVSHVLVRSSGDTFSFSGPAVEKLAYAECEMLDLDDAMFLLVGLGVEQGYGTRKLAHATTGARPELIKTGRDLVLAKDAEAEALAKAKAKFASLPNLRRDLLKEAAGLPDPTSVDTLLSLGFLNPENVTAFIASIPQIDQTQMRLCELLLAARLGLKNVPVMSLEKAIRAVEEVIQGLQVLAFSPQTSAG